MRLVGATSHVLSFSDLVEEPSSVLDEAAKEKIWEQVFVELQTDDGETQRLVRSADEQLTLVLKSKDVKGEWAVYGVVVGLGLDLYHEGSGYLQMHFLEGTTHPNCDSGDAEGTCTDQAALLELKALIKDHSWKNLQYMEKAPPEGYDAEATEMQPPAEEAPVREDTALLGDRPIQSVLHSTSKPIFVQCVLLLCLVIAAFVVYAAIGASNFEIGFSEPHWYIYFVLILMIPCGGVCVTGLVTCPWIKREDELLRWWPTLDNDPLFVVMTVGGVVLTVVGLAYGVHANIVGVEVKRVLGTGGLLQDLCATEQTSHAVATWAPGVAISTEDPHHQGSGQVKWEFCGKTGCTMTCLMVQPVIEKPGNSQCSPSNTVQYWAFYGKSTSGSNDNYGACQVPTVMKGAVLVDKDHYFPPICDSSPDGTMDGDDDRLSKLKKAKDSFLSGHPQYRDSATSQYVYMCDDPVKSAENAEQSNKKSFSFVMLIAAGIFFVVFGICSAGFTLAGLRPGR